MCLERLNSIVNKYNLQNITMKIIMILLKLHKENINYFYFIDYS